MTYQDIVSNFKAVDSSQAEAMLKSKDPHILYIGRETCPFCRFFVHKLQSIAEKKSMRVYYLDSGNFLDFIGISQLRKKFSIPTVPAIIRTGSDFQIVCDSGMTDDEIEEFINQALD